MKKMKSGDLGKGESSHARWCEKHNNYHGILFICDSYPDDLKQKLVKDRETFRKNLNDPEWVKKQNVEPEVIEIFKIFAGDKTPG